MKVTPVELHDGVYVKRDDLYRAAGVCGGKVRACHHLATRATDERGAALPRAAGLITASSRASPQAQIVAHMAHSLGIPARCHMPQGAKTEEMIDVEAHGGELVQHKAGYNNVIIRRALDDAKTLPGWRYIPFGMEHPAAMACTRGQARALALNIATGKLPKPKRVVVPVGSGMSAAGVLGGDALEEGFLLFGNHAVSISESFL